MTDIPLRSFRRNRTRPNYIPLNNNEVEADTSTNSTPGRSDNTTNMPTTMGITKAAVATSNTLRNGNLRRKGKGRYVDDPEEEERLLGGPYDGSEDDAGIEEQAPSPPKVSFALDIFSGLILKSSSVHSLIRPQRRSKVAATAKTKTNLGRYLLILLVGTFPSTYDVLKNRPSEKLQSRFTANIVKNQKYNAFTFLPLVFYEQFKFFFNMYFLLVALSQFIPALKIGSLFASPVSRVFIMGCRFYHHVYRSSCFRSLCNDGQGSIR